MKNQILDAQALDQKIKDTATALENAQNAILKMYRNFSTDGIVLRDDPYIREEHSTGKDIEEKFMRLYSETSITEASLASDTQKALSLMIACLEISLDKASPNVVEHPQTTREFATNAYIMSIVQTIEDTNNLRLHVAQTEEIARTTIHVAGKTQPTDNSEHSARITALQEQLDQGVTETQFDIIQNEATLISALVMADLAQIAADKTNLQLGLLIHEANVSDGKPTDETIKDTILIANAMLEKGHLLLTCSHRYGTQLTQHNAPEIDGTAPEPMN